MVPPIAAVFVFVFFGTIEFQGLVAFCIVFPLALFLSGNQYSVSKWVQISLFFLLIYYANADPKFLLVSVCSFHQILSSSSFLCSKGIEQFSSYAFFFVCVLVFSTFLFCMSITVTTFKRSRLLRFRIMGREQRKALL